MSNTVIDTVISWCKLIANDDTHGYSQTDRWGPDYDCSSYVITAWDRAGVPVKSRGASDTSNMYPAFKACGFFEVSISSRIRGDVLLNVERHTAIYLGDNRIIQASGVHDHPETGDQTGLEIAERDYYDYPWDYCLRYTGSITYEWNAKRTGGYSKESSEAQANAVQMMITLVNQGWSLEAIAGALGNIQAESGLNPWRWQDDIVLASTNPIWRQDTPEGRKHGYGLVQFTIASKYIDNDSAKQISGYGPNFSDKAGKKTDGYAQTLVISDDRLHNWYARSWAPDDFRMSFDNFKTINDVYRATGAWLWCYEYPSDIAAALPTRYANAIYWYEYLGGHPIPPISKELPPWLIKMINDNEI